MSSNRSSQDLSSIKHATALVNPVSSSNKRGQRRLRRLEEASPFKISTVYTSENEEATKETIRESLEGSDLLLVISGDGTFNTVVRTIISNSLSEGAKLTPIWSLGGGNAEDGTKASHTKLSRALPDNALSKGRIVHTNPIRFDVTHPDGEKLTYPAAFYATLGASALLASKDYLSSERYRNSLLAKYSLTRSLSELPISLYGLMSASQSSIATDNLSEDFFDAGYINSHIMAKHLRFPTNLTKPEIFHYVIPNRQKLARYIAHGLIDGKPDGEYLRPGDFHNFSTERLTIAQFDGEAETIPAGSQVSVSIHDQPLRVVVTRPGL
ncbi:MAG: diacylglycerol kinase family protein [Candidatus Saccharimonadales bacterium]